MSSSPACASMSRRVRFHSAHDALQMGMTLRMVSMTSRAARLSV